MSPHDKPLVWLKGEVKTPPLGDQARVEAGFLLRRLQRGELIGLPASRPMPAIGTVCHELRVRDGGANWRLMYHVADDAIVVLDVFAKKTQTTPKSVLEACRKRLAAYLKDYEGTTQCALRRSDDWNAPDGRSATRAIFSNSRLSSADSSKPNWLSRTGCVGAVSDSA